jgi:secretion/DNA translocation related CpaE-like protein
VSRPLLVTSDPDALDDLLRLVATAGLEADVAPDLAAARGLWELAPIVVVVDDQLHELAVRALPRRSKVVVLGRDLDDAGVWQRAVDVGAEKVVFLPDGESWLLDAVADAVEGQRRDGRVVAVVGGRGGAGATTLACALGLTSSRRGFDTLLVDGDPLGGGIDLVFGAEREAGVRWPDLSSSRGRIPAAALAQAVPRMCDLPVLSCDRSDSSELSAAAVAAVLGAARRSHDLVVVDLSRHLDAVAREVLAGAATTVLVVPAEVRAVAAASVVASRVAPLCRDLRLVVRGPAPAGLSAGEVQRALGLPLAGETRAEPGLASLLEEGHPPAQRRSSPLAALCHRLLDDLIPDSVRRAA